MIHCVITLKFLNSIHLLTKNVSYVMLHTLFLNGALLRKFVKIYYFFSRHPCHCETKNACALVMAKLHVHALGASLPCCQTESLLLSLSPPFVVPVILEH